MSKQTNNTSFDFDKCINRQFGQAWTTMFGKPTKVHVCNQAPTKERQYVLVEDEKHTSLWKAPISTMLNAKPIEESSSPDQEEEYDFEDYKY